MTEGMPAKRPAWFKRPGTDIRKLTGRPWRRLVERIKLRDQYTCQKCGRVTVEGDVDHRIPVSKGGTDDESNLQYLCREPCHRGKTIEDEGGKPRAEIGLDGWPARSE